MNFELSPSTNLSAAELQLIGSTLSWWSACEHLMFDAVMLARAMPSIRQAGVAWPIRTASGQLIKQWRDVAVALDAIFALKTDISSLCSRLELLNRLRNLIVHGFYDFDISLSVITVELLRWDEDLGTFRSEPHIVDVSTLLSLRNEMIRVHQDLIAWSEQLNAAVRDLHAREPMASIPSWPEVLRLPPKRMQF